MLGDLFRGGIGHSLLDTKRKLLMDMEARYDALQGPMPQPKPAPPTPAQQRAQVLANVGTLETERDKVIAAISDPMIRQKVKTTYDEKIQKELDKL